MHKIIVWTRRLKLSTWSNRGDMADLRANDRRHNGSRAEADRIRFFTAEFESAAMERVFRIAEAGSQRNLVLVLCAMVLFLAIAFSLITGLQNSTPSLFFQAYRVIQLSLAMVLFVMALRKVEYKKLEYVLSAFISMVVLQTFLLQDIADPEKLALLGRNLTIITIGHILLPTRFIYACWLMGVMAIISVLQITFFQKFGVDEKLALGTLIVCLTLVGIVARWQREVTGRRRYRAARERDNLVDALRDSESRMRLISDNVPSFITYVDHEQILRFTNQTGTEWYQIEREDVIGFHLRKMLGDNYDGARPYIDAALRGEPVRFERVLTYPDGKIRTIDVHHLPHCNEAGDVLGFFNQAFDMTDIKQSEVELKQAQNAAEMANRAKSEFLANMSHELRTPLNAVIGFSDAMLAGLTGELRGKQKEYLSDISSSGGHLLSLINDLLDLSKIEAGKLEIFPEDVNVDDLIIDSLPFVREQADKRNIQLNHKHAQIGSVLHVDRRMLRQMLVNLLSNAVKFSSEDSFVTISTMITDNNEFEITVSDTGMGMAPEEIPKAIAPFEQTESGINAGGTGLGLPLVDKMMAMHSGSLEIERMTGQGTTVSLRFPAMHGTAA